MKLPTNATHIKVPLSALRITDNVRKDFNAEDIERLAQSIRRNGLMNPITVRPPVEDENGNKTYEVIAGGRRIRAHQWLCDHGDDFSMIECCVRTGDTWTLQMIENIQRTDLSPREKEEAVARALESGLTMTDIADRLCKSIQYVSDIVAGMKVRAAADQAGIATDDISTKALSQLRSIPEERRADAVKELAESGGTFREATRIMHEANGIAEPPEEAETTNVSSAPEYDGTEEDPFDIEPKIEKPEPPETEIDTSEPPEELLLSATSDELCGVGFYFIDSFFIYAPKNKLHKAIGKFIEQFSRTLVHAKHLSAVINFIKNEIGKLNGEFPNITPVIVDFDKLDAKYLLSAQTDGKFDNMVFTTSIKPISGNAVRRLNPSYSLDGKFSIYGNFRLENRAQQFDLDGLYTLEEAKKRKETLARLMPGVDWCLFDEQNRIEADVE